MYIYIYIYICIYVCIYIYMLFVHSMHLSRPLSMRVYDVFNSVMTCYSKTYEVLEP